MCILDNKENETIESLRQMLKETREALQKIHDDNERKPINYGGNSIISDAERIRSNAVASRNLSFAADYKHIIDREGHSFSGSGTVSFEKLEEMIKKSKYFQSKSNW